ncbi:hypothetical protein LWI28_007087 [Acer negundo]|uniref:Gnk2-homologous domain-containing protein n=1 Tax=Acer negundo TaxID=4023 RepID=A0AAD5JFC5_ACENE|nr:hypothetical protein LWI28_007087 [Acer negundo]
MASSPLLFFLCSILLHFLALTIAQPQPLSFFCSNDKGNFSANSTYNTNLNSLLSSLSTTKIDNGFFNSSYGENPDTRQQHHNEFTIAIANANNAIATFTETTVANNIATRISISSSTGYQYRNPERKGEKQIRNFCFHCGSFASFAILVFFFRIVLENR